MKRALLYKEWKKTKWVSLGILFGGFLLILYIFMNLGRAFRFAGMEHLWDVVVNRDQFLFRDLKYFPLVSGICLGLAQFIPEMVKKRIKLTLHLPLSEKTIISVMLCFGLVLLLGIFLLHLLTIYIFAGRYFSGEIVNSMWITTAPWYLGGITAYMFIAMICIEPTWRIRLFDLLVMMGTIKVFFFSDFPGAYGRVVAFIFLIPVYVMPFAFLSVDRFKTGEQD